MASKDVRHEDRDQVRWIILHRPESRNGLTVGTAGELAEAFKEAANTREVRAVVLFGEGGAFCSGLDLKSFSEAPPDMNAGLEKISRRRAQLRGLMKPTIAAIDGPAAGFGADLALAADLRIGSKTARLGERFVRLGLVPDGGGTYALPRLVGLAKAFELIYEGRMVEAQEAQKLGLLNRVIDSNFKESVQQYAAEIAKGPPLAYAAAKRAIHLSSGDFEAALRAEGEAQLKLLQSSDFMEGVSAFLQKRPPAFEGQ